MLYFDRNPSPVVRGTKSLGSAPERSSISTIAALE